MKKLLVIVMLFVGVTTVFGQMSDDEVQDFKTEMQEKFKALNLSDEQQTQFETIQLKYLEQMGEVRYSNDSKIAKLKSLKAIQKNKNKEMEAILDKDQYKQYLEIQKEVRKKMKENYKNHRNE